MCTRILHCGLTVELQCRRLILDYVHAVCNTYYSKIILFNNCYIVPLPPCRHGDVISVLVQTGAEMRPSRSAPNFKTSSISMNRAMEEVDGPGLSQSPAYEGLLMVSGCGLCHMTGSIYLTHFILFLCRNLLSAVQSVLAHETELKNYSIFLSYLLPLVRILYVFYHH